MINDILNEADTKMDKSVEATREEFATIRAGRAQPSMFNKITVDYYGTETPISQLANISVPEPRQLLIQPWDKQTIPLIEKAIMRSDLGINPNNDGTGIRLNFPQMTEDRRKDMVKQVHARLENCKVAIRNIRRDVNDHLKQMVKKKEIGEDEEKGHEAKMQKLTDQYVAKADELGKKKDAELLTV